MPNLSILFRCVILLAFSIFSPSLAFAGQSVVQLWLTTADQTNLLTQKVDQHFQVRSAANIDVRVDSSKTYQSMQGFGAAMTDASAIILQRKMSAEQRDKVMAELFGRENGGLGFDFTRITIGASDFSEAHYSLDDAPKDQTDEGLRFFSSAPQAANLVPSLQQALKLNPTLKIMATPWSAPAWMKSNRHLYQGSLNPDFYDVYAHYFLKFIRTYEQSGIPIDFLSIQNEPHFEPTNYPGMRFDSKDRARFVGHYLGPLLSENKVRTRIFDWDHNWDQPESPLAVLADAKAAPYIAGIAWHCYAGSPSAQTIVHDLYPTKETWLTECSGGGWDADWDSALPSIAGNLIIGSTRHWAKGVLMWNLILDQHDSPHLGGCDNCRGVLTYNTETGEIKRNIEYYAFGHISRFVRTGAKRIASTSGIDGIDTVAFENEDASKVLLICNSAVVAHTITVEYDGKRFAYTLPRKSVMTAVWK